MAGRDDHRCRCVLPAPPHITTTTQRHAHGAAGVLPALPVQAAAVLGEIAAVDPSEYERQQNASGEKAGVRSVAAFVKDMANQLPRWVAGWVGWLGC